MNRLPFVEWWKSALEFLRDVRGELKNVSWPNKKEVQGTTMVVIVAVFVFGFYLWVVDIAVHNAIHFIFKYFSSGAA